MGIEFADHLGRRNDRLVGEVAAALGEDLVLDFSSATRIHNDLVIGMDNQGNFILEPAHSPQIFRNPRPKKYFEKISKKFSKLPKISRNYEKVPESPLGRNSQV